jgi:hypothetical protein
MRVRIRRGIGWNRGMEGKVFRVIDEEEFSKYMDFKCPTYFLPVEHPDNTKGNVKTVKKTNVEIIEEESGLDKFKDNEIVRHPKGTFVKVCRAPKIGDQILIIDSCLPESLSYHEKYQDGDILTVTGLHEDQSSGIVYCQEIQTSGNWNGQIDGHEYVVVEPFEEGPDVERAYEILKTLGETAGLMPSEIILAIRTIMEVYNKTEPQVKLADPIPKESSRDVVIKNAIKYIEDAKCTGEQDGKAWEYRQYPTKEGLGRGYAMNAEFIVDVPKRTVVCLLRCWTDRKILFKGKAKAANSDCFNIRIGKAIALSKALGWTTPNEFLWAPSPSGVKEGDIFKFHAEDQTVYTVLSTEKDLVYGDSKGNYMGVTNVKPFKIVDDSARYPQ